MPFSRDYKNTYDCAIRPGIIKAGAYCQRLDELIFAENMLEKIYNEINKADFILADLSTKNANVFYELGYAHALNKKVLLITDSDDDIPFDLKHYQYLHYDRANLLELENNITSRIDYYINEPYQPEYKKIPYKLRINGNDLVNNGNYLCLHYQRRSLNCFDFEIDVVNEDMVYHRIGKNKIFLYIEKRMMDNEDQIYSIYENDRLKYSMNKMPSLFPLENGLLSTSIVFNDSNSLSKHYNQNYEAELRIHFPFNVLSIPFNFELRYKDSAS